MRCSKCGFEFDEGVFCPECGAKNEMETEKAKGKILEEKRKEEWERKERDKIEQEKQRRECNERMLQAKIEQERLAKERIETEERLAKEKKKQERLSLEKVHLKARTYNGIVYADEREARLANEENGKIDALKQRLIPITSQEARRKILTEFETKETIQTVEAKKRYDLLKVKIHQEKPKTNFYNFIYGISVILAIVITMIMGTMGSVENAFFFIIVLWYGIGIPVWIIWKILLIIKSRGKKYYLYIKDI